MDVKLTDDEVKALRAALQPLVIKTRTGELGIVAGMDRFVSTGRVLKKADRDTLDAAAKKLGLSSGLSVADA